MLHGTASIQRFVFRNMIFMNTIYPYSGIDIPMHHVMEALRPECRPCEIATIAREQPAEDVSGDVLVEAQPADVSMVVVRARVSAGRMYWGVYPSTSGFLIPSVLTLGPVERGMVQLSTAGFKIHLGAIDRVGVEIVEAGDGEQDPRLARPSACGGLHRVPARHLFPFGPNLLLVEKDDGEV